MQPDIGQKDGFNMIANKLVTTGVMKTLKFSFLLVNDEDFNGG
ncbi:hypothetical protein [Intestinirhabdus alba]|jgi:hypothetical protein|nr:hypothetical protein [Intestinirhabdus alba]